ncbi:response regulator [Desulfobaculum bizertense]|uniref:Response regulator receiver domain-containing protein n=1 Tax=Desulfobaculum bizertense DSM 18034 TaxID=1121442 RepID=A0A1T4VJ60_9BACT|nr:response regulator [Desulfobaculum bizertense]UIJ37960.1 response regulator [Desulfobaculum bizertense]SKA65000.1 Response regulator receiver domain-containing protein [Desulfobaculum bizertense DSM 18034]
MTRLKTGVLIVDDEQPFVDALNRRLGKRGFECLSAHSGADALEKLALNTHVDVVVLDIRMPGMDGIEALRRIRSSFPLVQVIMLTGHGTVESAVDGMKYGAFDYLIKPCDIEELAAKITEAKERKGDEEDEILEEESQNIVLRRGD